MNGAQSILLLDLNMRLEREEISEAMYNRMTALTDHGVCGAGGTAGDPTDPQRANSRRR